MTPFDLGVREDLGVPPPLPGDRPEGYTTPKLPIPAILDPRDLCRSPEAKKAGKSLKLKKTSFSTVEYEASGVQVLKRFFGGFQMIVVATRLVKITEEVF